MKKLLLSFILISTTTTLFAQYEGHVGINTETPTSTLHVKSKGSTANTQSLKVESSTGTNLLTINDDGTVSGTAAANLSSGSVVTPKASGLFSSMSAKTSSGYLSTAGDTFGIINATTTNYLVFTGVAQTVPFDARLNLLTFRITPSVISDVLLTTPLSVELYVNGSSTGLVATIINTVISYGSYYVSAPTSPSIRVYRGDLIAYRLRNFPEGQINCAVSMKYTEL